MVVYFIATSANLNSFLPRSRHTCGVARRRTPHVAFKRWLRSFVVEEVAAPDGQHQARYKHQQRQHAERSRVQPNITGLVHPVQKPAQHTNTDEEYCGAESNFQAGFHRCLLRPDLVTERPTATLIASRTVWRPFATS